MARPAALASNALIALIVVSAMFGAAPMRAADPVLAPPSSLPVPPLLPDGPVTLGDGTVLPVAPAELSSHESVQAEMASEHANDHITFTPGIRPSVPLAVPGASLAPDQAAGAVPFLALADSSAVNGAVLTALPNGLRKEVLGFLPYWMLDASDLQWMQYQLVSTIAFFGVAAKSDGTLATYAPGWSGWYSAAMTGVINTAHSRGVKVVLTITMMAWDGGAQQAALLGSATARARLISAIVAAIRDRNADGVNLDFEPVAVAERDRYTSFVRELKAALLAAVVGSNLTVCTMAGAATWATGYDLAGLVAPGAADALFVMGYDFSWSGSARAGGVAPMDSPYILDVNEAVTDYLEIVPGSKVIWGVPYYGRTWLTQSSDLNALARSGASGSSVAYWYTGNLTLAGRYGRLWDAVGKVPWFRYYDSAAGSWVEGYYDDAVSLAAKWDMVNQRGLAGTGMWTLLMDAGHQELWNLLATKFASDVTPPTGGITTLPPTTDALAIPVSWRAVDVGSGLLHYSVQVRDRSGSTWTPWLTDTTATSGYWVGQPGNAYEFRMSATDRRGNRQAWQANAPDPTGSLTVGGFASVMAEGLNVRSGAGTGFGVLDQLALGDRAAVLAGPIVSGGYAWYQIQWGFTEWPSADYPMVGWAAAGAGATPYLAPAMAPTVTTLAPSITAYGAEPRRFSPNGDGVRDGTQVAFTLVHDAALVQVEVVNASGSVVQTAALGPMAAGSRVAAWDGRVAGGAWAQAGAYLLRVTATDAHGAHMSPAAGVDAAVLTAWGVTADLAPPAVAVQSPSGDLAPTTGVIHATFTEPIVPSAAPIRLVDTTTNAPVAGVASYDPATRRAIFDTDLALAVGRAYRVELDPAQADEAGNALGVAGWTFTTVPVGVTAFDPWRTVSFASGTHVGYQFNATGQVTASKTYTLAQASAASTSLRSTIISGHPGAWLVVTNGIWAGYWIAESTRAAVSGAVGEQTFVRWRTVAFTSGTHTGYRFNATGQVTASKTSTLAAASSAASSGRAVINGWPHVLVANGIWAGYWVPESSRVVLVSAIPPLPPPPPPTGSSIFDPPRILTFASGTHVGYQFSSAGVVTATRTATLGASSSAATSQRASVSGQVGTWLAVTNGIWAGYWVQESSRVYLAGFVDETIISPWRSVAFAAGEHTGYLMSSTGAVTGSKTYTLVAGSSASASGRAVINGRSYVRIANGIWTGYWVPESGTITLQ